MVSAEEAAFIQDVLSRAAIPHDTYRLPALVRRVPACLRLLRCRTLEDVRRRLEARPEVLEELLNTLLIGVTDFFRDHEPWAAIEKLIVPELLAQNHAPRILSAGCSDGAELYSLGMLLAEKQRLGGACLLGLDCRSRALRAASEGLYSLTALRCVPQEMVDRYFAAESGGYRIAWELRNAASWQLGDVSNFTSDQQFDLVACRNLAIYLESGPAERLWGRLCAALRPGGILFVGKAERPSGKLHRIAPCIYKKVEP